MAIDASSELVMIVDSRNLPVGSLARREMRARRLPHRATYVLVTNSAGELFVQQRTLTKDIYPGYADIAAGGVVCAGEDWESAAARELHEELGISGVPLRYRFECEYADPQTHVFGRVWDVTWDGPVVLQPEEVAGGAFQPVERILSDIERGAKFTPDGVMVLKRWVAMLR
jgi:8-oxo-dGTP pyrophosphatase MutT (NUDIX family)